MTVICRFRVLAVLAAAVAVALVTYTPASAQSAGATFTVNQTTDGADADPGDGACDASDETLGSQCTLRAAIGEANASPGADTIGFNIGGGGGVKSIVPTSALPTIIDKVTIDGYTQPGASPNTQAQGTNAVLAIELNGILAGNAGGLVLSSNINTGTTSEGSVVKGLVINNFQRGGISGASSTRIEGNFIGTDPSGETDRGNGFNGVSVGANSTVGGTTPEARNLVSGNGMHGVGLGGDSGSSKAQGNLIGTDKDGTADLGNDLDGVAVSSSNNAVGGTQAGAANTIAFNGRSGVGIGLGVDGDDAVTGNRVLSNSIFSNAELGIDFGPGGPTANDPKDPDVGNNRRQNHPVLATATGASGTTTATGTLDSRPRKSFTIQFFVSPASGPDEGRTFLGQKTVKTNKKGKATFSFAAVGDLSGQSVTATATNNATGDTSEFSAAVTVS